MKKFVIVTDSCSDLSVELMQRFDIDYARMGFVVDGVEHYASLAWDEYSPKAFYDLMRNGKRITTTQVSVEEFRKVFTKHLEAGMDILYTACSSGLSGSINAANIVANELADKYPNNKIVCVDCLNSGAGEGLIAIKASQLRAEGKSIDEVSAWIVQNRLRFQQFGCVDNLDYLKRAGRVKASAAFFGNIFGIKPIVISDAKGCNVAFKKVKGRKSSLIESVNLAKDVAEGYPDQIVIIGHADCLEEAMSVKEMVEQNIPCKEVIVGNIGPTVGASVGPGTIGIWLFGKELTFVGE